MLINLLFILLGYLSGSLASAIIVCRLLGLEDPRRGGSGNPGATNVLRLHGRRSAALTLAGDLLKGLLPVLLAHWLGLPGWAIALTGLAAFTGHLYPLFFGFQGGKGVATLIGVLFGLDWRLGAVFVGTWLLVAALFRYSSLAALLAAAATPLAAWLLLSDTAHVAAISVMTALLIWRHRSNIRNLIAGTEDKMGQKREE